MLIRNAEVYKSGIRDLRIQEDAIVDMGRLTPIPGEVVIDASGSALIPGLIDHHIHFLSYAASLNSIDCSPSSVGSGKELALLLQKSQPPKGWLRGFGYHESVAGDIDRFWLDRHCPSVPIRIQHRTGRLWIFNSCGIELLQQAMKIQMPAPALSNESLQTGRFFDSDQLLGPLLGRHLPPVKRASEVLASYGITGFSDMTPSNDQESFDLFNDLLLKGNLLQEVQLARRDPFDTPSLSAIPGPVKIHLHESRLPALDELVERIRHSHQNAVPVAIHCVTEIELLFSLAALEEAQSIAGDRIEHASITPEYIFERMASLGVTVVSQPQFIGEKGDSYLKEIDPLEHSSLYRCKTFLDQGIGLAGSSDAPFGNTDPWTTMRCAISRKTRSGRLIGEAEALSPEQALDLFLGPLSKPGTPRTIKVGDPADLCLLKHPWEITRTRLYKEDVQLVIAKGKLIHQNPAFTISSPYAVMSSIKPQSNAV